ncbi:hypothetical protein GCM10027456_19850 [Kineosporia babensis]
MLRSTPATVVTVTKVARAKAEHKYLEQHFWTARGLALLAPPGLAALSSRDDVAVADSQEH